VCVCEVETVLILVLFCLLVCLFACLLQSNNSNNKKKKEKEKALCELNEFVSVSCRYIDRYIDR